MTSQEDSIWRAVDVTPDERLSDMHATFLGFVEAYVQAELEIRRAHRAKARALDGMIQTRHAMAQLCSKHPELKMPSTKLATLLEYADADG